MRFRGLGIAPQQAENWRWKPPVLHKRGPVCIACWTTRNHHRQAECQVADILPPSNAHSIRWEIAWQIPIDNGHCYNSPSSHRSAHKHPQSTCNHQDRCHLSYVRRSFPGKSCPSSYLCETLTAVGTQIYEHYFKSVPLLMDRAYEDNETRYIAQQLYFAPVVPPKKNRKDPWDYDKELYKLRSKIERLFCLIQGFWRVFCRFDKLDVMYSAFAMLAHVLSLLDSGNTP